MKRILLYNEHLSFKEKKRQELFNEYNSEVQKYVDYFKSLSVPNFTEEKYRRTKFNGDHHEKKFSDEVVANLEGDDYRRVCIIIFNDKVNTNLIVSLNSYQSVDNHQQKGRMLAKLLTNYGEYEKKPSLLDMLIESSKLGYNIILKAGEDSGNWYSGKGKDPNVFGNLFTKDMFEEKAIAILDSSWCYILPYFLELAEPVIIQNWWNDMVSLPEGPKLMRPIMEEIKKTGKWDYVYSLIKHSEPDISNSFDMDSMGFYD